MAVDPSARQFVGGTLVHERTGEIVQSFLLGAGKRVTGVSFPSPEAVVVPMHTRARSVRTFMAMGSRSARTIHRFRRLVPPLVRAIRPLLERRIAGTQDGPKGEARSAEFEIVAQAKGDGEVVRVFVKGRDPYGLTAEIQAWAAERAVRGEVTARGVVAPSVGYPPSDAFAALAPYGVSVS
jgi:hypothetical protein